ncbi:unnamed protein product, partial [Heterosigma akashiwo]
GRDGLEAFLGGLSAAGLELVESRPAPRSYVSNPLVEADDDQCLLHFVDLASNKFMLHEFRRIARHT